MRKRSLSIDDYRSKHRRYESNFANQPSIHPDLQNISKQGCQFVNIADYQTIESNSGSTSTEIQYSSRIGSTSTDFVGIVL